VGGNLQGPGNSLGVVGGGGGGQKRKEGVLDKSWEEGGPGEPKGSGVRKPPVSLRWEVVIKTKKTGGRDRGKREKDSK